MTEISKDIETPDFVKPDSVVEVAVEKGSNPPALPSDHTPKENIVTELFVKGTEPTSVSETFDKLVKKGVKTIVSMHMSEGHFAKAKDMHINVVIAGHMSSDTLGLNLLLDGIQKNGKFNIICCSGFRRFPRSHAWAKQ